MNELDLIERLVRAGWRPSPGIVLGPGDDAAVLRGGLVVSTDLMVEDVHFRQAWATPAQIGFRAGAAALSDMAAMGAEPLALLVSLAVPAADGRAVEIQEGVAEAARRAGASVIGGDVSRSPGPVMVDVVALGQASTPVTRAGGRPGQDLWVSGSIGAASVAVAEWTAGGEPPSAAVERFLRPPDRTALGRRLAADGLATAMIDLSDGLAADAGHLARRSGVAVLLQASAVPVAAVARPVSGADPKGLNPALVGGEDYELLFASDPASAPAIERLSEALDVPLTRVGRLDEGEGVILELPDGKREALRGGGFDHFATGSSSG